ncbi:MAG: IS110 family transposase [Rhizobacter sp.]
MTNQPHIIGIDLGKHWFHLIGLDREGAVVLRKKMNRAQLATFAATASRTIVAMESCSGSQYWGRVFAQAGHEVRLVPAQYVKPFVKTNKNDFNDAHAIAEAASRPSMRFVPLKTPEQLELQALHRIRRRLVHQRTAVVNQLRALLLEHGVVTPVGRETFARRLPTILETADALLSPRLRVLVQRLRAHWLALDDEITEATDELTAWAAASPLCQRVLTVPGVGPMIATAVVAAVGDARMFARGRDMAAWLGLVPRQFSTGGKPTLGSISKRGNGYVRQLFLQGAVSSYLWVKRDRSALGAWLDQLDRRCHRPVVITALANKMVRICWKVLTSEETFQPYPSRAVEHAG